MTKLITTLIVLAVIIKVIMAASSGYSYDGSNNNQDNPNWGKVGSRQIRKVPAAYADNIGSPVGGNPSTLPSARLISNLLFGREASGCRKTNKRLVTDVLTYWGQFVDHDLDLTLDTATTGNCDSFPIPIPKGDPFYDPRGTGNATMKFCRTIPVAGTGIDPSNKREFPNSINAWLDGSQVYGNNADLAKVLRTLEDGKMKTSNGPDGELLPINDDGKGGLLNRMANFANRVPTNQLFAAGDARANENPILTALQTLFVREHNRRASLLPESWSDEEKYQEARRWVIAHIQAITFNEYIPALTGKPVEPYNYNSSLDPQISLFFSTVAYRFGHDEVSGILPRYDRNGLPYVDGHVLLRDAYSFPTVVKVSGIAPFLRGAAVNQQNDVDAMLDEDMRTFLFNQSSAFATDLAARNMQRARDHGIPGYNECRKAYGLSTCDTFSCINDNPRIVSLLNDAYGNDRVDLLDPFLGGLIEEKEPGSNLGELFSVSILEQFVRTRNADRFWYQNEGVFTSEELKSIEETKLSDIFMRNMDIPCLPRDIFTRKEISPSDALRIADTNVVGGDGRSNARWIIPISVLSAVCAFLVILVVILMIVALRKRHVQRDIERDNKMQDARN